VAPGVCILVHSPALPARLSLPNVASFLCLIKWHASCFMAGVLTEKGYINEQAKRTAQATLVSEGGGLRSEP
jgi:hypothetical protein